MIRYSRKPALVVLVLAALGSLGWGVAGGRLRGGGGGETLDQMETAALSAQLDAQTRVHYARELIKNQRYGAAEKACEMVLADPKEVYNDDARWGKAVSLAGEGKVDALYDYLEGSVLGSDAKLTLEILDEPVVEGVRRGDKRFDEMYRVAEVQSKD